jgi:voltage-gated potassium channel
MKLLADLRKLFLKIRKLVFQRLLDSHDPNNLHAKFENFVATLILLNFASMLVEHIPEIYEPYAVWFKVFDHISLTVFSAEYLLRLYVAPEDPEFNTSRFPRLKYIFSLYALIDLSAILPFYLSAFIDMDLRLLRILRLLRLFKLFRVLVPAYKDFMYINADRTFRQKIHALVWPSERGGKLHEFFDLFIVLWVMISVLGVIFESVESIHYLLNVEFAFLDVMAVWVFTLEYLMRFYSCVEDPQFPGRFKGTIKFTTSPNAVIDFLAIIPFFLEAFLHHLFDLRFLRIFRMMRLLKLTRFTDATQMMILVLRREWPVMAASMFVMMLVVVMTASLGYLFEHDAQPDKFENIPQSIYWAVITLTSVGYGDISPVTPLGRVITIGISVMGIAIVAIPAGILSAAFTDQLRIERETLRNELIEMLADGTIDETERAFIEQEAKRLHIQPDEIDRLMLEAQKQHDAQEHHEQTAAASSGFDLKAITQNSDIALTQFRILVSQLDQVFSVLDEKMAQQRMQSDGYATILERSIWYMLLSNRAVLEQKQAAVTAAPSAAGEAAIAQDEAKPEFTEPPPAEPAKPAAKPRSKRKPKTSDDNGGSTPA